MASISASSTTRARRTPLSSETLNSNRTWKSSSSRCTTRTSRAAQSARTGVTWTRVAIGIASFRRTSNPQKMHRYKRTCVRACVCVDVCLWGELGVALLTKLAVYQALVLSTLLYGCEYRVLSFEESRVAEPDRKRAARKQQVIDTTGTVWPCDRCSKVVNLVCNVVEQQKPNTHCARCLC